MYIVQYSMWSAVLWIYGYSCTHAFWLWGPNTHPLILHDIGGNSLLGNRKKIAKFLMRTFTCRSTCRIATAIRKERNHENYINNQGCHFPRKKSSAEHRRDGNFYSFRRNSVCSAERKMLGIPFQAVLQKIKKLGIPSNPFCRRERNLELHNFVPVRHVTGNDKDYLRKIPRVVW